MDPTRRGNLWVIKFKSAYKLECCLEGWSRKLEQHNQHEIATVFRLIYFSSTQGKVYEVMNYLMKIWTETGLSNSLPKHE